MNYLKIWYISYRLNSNQIKAPQDTLQIAGYPSGGNNISIASGSVARFAMVPSLEAEVNIAVNPGNSGGPAFKGNQVIRFKL